MQHLRSISNQQCTCWGNLPSTYMCEVQHRRYFMQKHMRKKTGISQHKTQLNSVVFITLQPIVATVADYVCVVRFCFFLRGINNGPTYTKLPAKMNSGFWPTTRNLQNQRCCHLGLAKMTGTNAMTSSYKTYQSMLYNIVTEQVSQRTVSHKL